MNTLSKKWPAIALLLVSWLVIFWINFAAELSLMMHVLAVPVLLLSTAAGALHMLEPQDNATGSN